MAWLSSGRRNLRFEYDCTRQASQRDSVDHGSLGERVCLLPWLGIGLLFDSCGCPILGTAQFAFFTCTAASSWFERVQRAAWLSSGRRNSRFCGYGSYVAVLGTVAPATLSLRCSCERAAKSCMRRRCSDGDGGVRYAAFALRCTKPCRRRCRSGGDDGVRHAALALRCSNPAPCRCRLEGDRRQRRLPADDTSSSRFGAPKSCRAGRCRPWWRWWRYRRCLRAALASTHKILHAQVSPRWRRRRSLRCYLLHSALRSCSVQASP